MAQPVVVVTDVQERLFGAMDAERRDEMVRNLKILLAFSACGAAGFAERLRELDAAPVILTGVEAHVCVLLTALDLLGRGVRVSIVADAVCSRRAASMDLGLAQARQAGAVITSTETVVFQLLGSSDTEAFREISKLLR